LAEICNYYGEWRGKTFNCPNCDWLGSIGDMHMEAHAELADYSCPRCDKIVVIVSYPTIEETRTAAAAGNAEAAAELRRFDQQPPS
jgi:predicted RNA-binding Zn-ribbon protein involved in translation (DUF1610 family)